MHYFEWERTLKTVREIRRCLNDGGLLLNRLNSTKDVNFGAVGHEEIEPDLYRVNGREKRFFDSESIHQLFESGWELKSVEEMGIRRYEKLKIVWEIVLKKDIE